MSSILSHIDQLKWRAKELDKEIKRAYDSYTDDAKVKELKHKKFLLKEEIRLIKEKERNNGKNI